MRLLVAVLLALAAILLLEPHAAPHAGALLASVVYSSTLKNNRMQLVADLIAGKTAAASTGSATAGSLVIGTSALSGATGVLATVTLGTTPGTVSGGVLTLSGTPLTATASATGTAAKAELRDNSGNVIVSGLTVGTSGTDIIIDTTSIVSGETISVSSGTITHG